MADSPAPGARPASVLVALIVLWVAGPGILLVQFQLHRRSGILDWASCVTAALLLAAGALNLPRRPSALGYYWVALSSLF